MSDTSLKEELRSAIPIIKGDADIWALFRHPDLYNRVLEQMTEPFQGKITAVVGVEARGFILAQAIALKMHLPFIGIRKADGFFPGETFNHQSTPDYRGNQHILRIQEGAISKDDKLLLADDWIETGSQALCVKKLIESIGAEFYGVSTIVDQTKPERQKELGRFFGVITNQELYDGKYQHDYQTSQTNS